MLSNKLFWVHLQATLLTFQGPRYSYSELKLNLYSRQWYLLFSCSLCMAAKAINDSSPLKYLFWWQFPPGKRGKNYKRLIKISRFCISFRFPPCAADHGLLFSPSLFLVRQNRSSWEKLLLPPPGGEEISFQGKILVASPGLENVGSLTALAKSPVGRKNALWSWNQFHPPKAVEIN